MTSNSKESGTMGPLQERHQTSTLSRRSCSVPLQTRLTLRMRRRPARRALFELSHNDRRIERRRNFAFAENLLTIPVAEFKKKWNFDPVKMKPTNQIMSDNNVPSTDKIPADKADGTIIPRYEWIPMNENTEKKTLEKTLCSLVPNSARSMRLSYLAQRINSQSEAPVLEEDNNSTYFSDSDALYGAEISESSYESINSSIESNSSCTSIESQSPTEKFQESELLTENILVSSEIKPLESLPVENSSSSSAGKPLPAVEPGDAENKEGVQKSISVVTNYKDNSGGSSSSTAGIDPVPTECISVTAQSKNMNVEKSSKQLKITDFACQRKRVHSDTLVTSDNPPAKRLRPLL